MAASSKKWKLLDPGDVIDVVAPGFRCSDEALAAGVLYIESLGYKARVPKDIFGEDLVCANSDKKRLGHLKKALTAKDSKAIWCVRGGYGSLRLMPEIRKWKAPAKVKLLIGYSDITTLITYMNQKWKWPCLHGPLLDRLGEGPASAQEKRDLKDILNGEVTELSYSGLEALNPLAKKKKNLRADIVGGNLSVLASSVGTPGAFKGSGKILVLEDVGERAYSVDRMLQQMEQAGIFKGLKAMVLGDFLGGKDKDGISRTWALLEEFSKKQKFPVLRGLQVGHGDVQRPITLGVKAHLKLGSKSELIVPTGAKA